MRKNSSIKFSLVLALVFAMTPEFAHAFLNGGISFGGGGVSGGIGFGSGGFGAAGGIAGALCEIAGWFTEPGGVGSAIASIAIVFLGISAFFGKTTWGTALLFATGIFAIFGADQIINAITLGQAGGCGGGGFGLSIRF